MNNIKLLGIYYAAQKILLDNLAAPMGHGLKPILTSEDYELVANKTLPFLKKGVNREKLTSLVEKIFTQIDSGSIKPSQYVGHEFSVEETLDQFEVHDGFMALHAFFFGNLGSNDKEIEIVNDKVLTELVKLKFSAVEMMTLKELFTGASVRSPLTLGVDGLQDVVDCMYQSSCDVYGPTKTDQLLSLAVKDVSNKIPDFNAGIFL